MANQRGSGALIMVVMVLMMGGFMIQLSLRHIENLMPQVASEQRYQQAWQGAQSALAWGVNLQWKEVPETTCQPGPDAGSQACLLKSVGERRLLRGQAGELPWQIQLYRWVSAHQGRLVALPSGWSDFCPLSPSNACDETG
ncbi:hypothetical protein CIG19_06555 [Enterobacterales bacterium CwR94]|nr:hypothetical protein CIG19_06555 [Enterobacterales bacterium CwR94]